MRIRAVVLAAVLAFSPLMAMAQDQAHEDEAAALLAEAEKLETEGKFEESLVKYRGVFERYGSTELVSKKGGELRAKIWEIGTKATAAVLDKQGFYKRAHMDAWLGYEFVAPEGWRGVPPSKKFVGSGDASEANYKGQTIRATRYTSRSLEGLHVQVLKPFGATDLADVERRAENCLGDRVRGFQAAGEGAVTGTRHPTRRKMYVSQDGDRFAVYSFYSQKRGFALVGSWEAEASYEGVVKPGEKEGVQVMVLESKSRSVAPDQFEKAIRVFDQCAKSFCVYDDRARAGKKVQLSGEARCSDWEVMKSARGSYTIEYATDPAFAKRIGEELEEILAHYKQVIPTGKTISGCRVKVFGTAEDFAYYGSVPQAAAYWSPGQEEIVCYRFNGDKVVLDSQEEVLVKDAKRAEEVTLSVLRHEAFHQYMYYLMGRDRDMDAPGWVDEGLGDYFFGWQRAEGSRKIVAGPNSWRMPRIRVALEKNELVTLDRFLRYGQQEYYSSDPGLHYAQGWALIYFFLSDAGKKKGYAAIPQRMIQELKVSGNGERATAKVFSGINMEKLDGEFREFLKTLTADGDAAGGQK